MAEQTSSTRAASEVSFPELWNALWRGKWLIACTMAAAGAAAVAYALTATMWYRADVVLATAEDANPQGLLGQLGGLATLTGMNLGRRNNVEALAVLRSRDFTRMFIEEESLLPVLYEELWDAEAGQWKGSDPADWPDARDAVRLFDRTVRTISEDRTTGLVTVGIEWKDRDTAARWANRLVERLNEHMRQRALAEAETNVAYLQHELRSTGLVTLQQSIGSLLESELQKLMLARGNKEFSFRVIDRAEPPKIRSRPKRTQLVLLATAAAGILASLVVLARYLVRRS